MLEFINESPVLFVFCCLIVFVLMISSFKEIKLLYKQIKSLDTPLEDMLDFGGWL